MRSIKDNRHVTQLPPAGFYPDPRVPTQERRWDGERWTIETRPLPVSPSVSLPVIAVEQPSLGSGYARLASALQAVMFVYAGVAMVSAGFVLWQRSVFLSWRDDPNRVDQTLAEQMDLFSGVTSVIAVLAILAGAVLFIVWLWRGIRSNNVDHSYIEHADWWAIGGWFIPIWNRFRPFQMVGISGEPHTPNWRPAT